MLQEKYRVSIIINKEWFYKAPESVPTAGARLFEGIGFNGTEYDDDPMLRWVRYIKTINGSDIPRLMSNYENFPLYGEASVAKISITIEHSRLFEKPLDSEESLDVPS